MIKVLIADDQELIRQSLQIVLDSKEGLEVTDVAADGQEVIRCVRKQKPRGAEKRRRLPPGRGADGYPDAQDGRRPVHKDYQGKLSAD